MADDTGLFDDINWGKVLTPVVQSVAQSIVPAYTASRGLKRVEDANRRAADISATGVANASGAVNAGADTATANLDAMKQRSLDASAPATSYMRSVVARNPYELTPEQQAYLATQREQFINTMDPGIRGSGKAYTAAAKNFTTGVSMPLINQNIGRADQAASTLNSQGVNAANAADTGMASVATGQGNQLAGITTGGANTAANASTATGAAQADTMGAIGGFFANAANNAARESRYGKFSYGDR